MLLATLGGLLTILAASAVDGMDLTAGTIAGLLVVLGLGAAAWASIGTVLSASIPTVDRSWPVFAATYLPVVFLSGSFGTMDGLPGWLTAIVDQLPARPMVTAASRLRVAARPG